MQGEREKNRQVLIERYGLSRRAAGRVLALLQKKVDFTPTILEMATPDTAAEKVLLTRELMKDADGVNEDSVRKIAEDAGFEESDLLRVVHDDEEGWDTIALEDDVLADQVEQEGAATEEESVAKDLVKSEPKGMSKAETEELLGGDAMAQIKLDALTSQDVSKRSEALRKLVFAPMDGARKAGIFVNVLIDPEAEPRVRREAVRSLEQIGFRSDLAEAVRGLFESEEDEAVYYIRRLETLLKDAEVAEQSVAIAVALEVFNQAKDKTRLQELLRLLSSLAPILTDNRDKTEQFLRGALKHLSSDFQNLRSRVEYAILQCRSEQPELLTELLWQELRRNENANIRAFLTTILIGLTVDEDLVQELADRAVSEILNPDLMESERSRLRYGMVRLGEPVAQVALDKLHEAEPRNHPELIRMLNVVCTEGQVGEDILDEAAQALLDLLKVGSSTSRKMIVDADLPSHPGVDASLRRQFAVELLSHMREFQLADTIRGICDSLEKIGASAVRPLFDYVRRNYPKNDSIDASETLARVIRNEPEEISADLANEIISYCDGLLDKMKLKKGAFTEVLASVAGYTEEGDDEFDRLLKKMRGKLWKARYSFDMLYAMGIMAGSPNASREHQESLFEIFDRILAARAPEEVGVRKETPEGPVYEFGKEIDFDTRVIPAAVKGLDQICTSDQASSDIRHAGVKKMLVLWEGVANMRIVWSPAAVDALVKGMCNAACCEMIDVDVRLRLGRSLMRFLNKLNVVESMGTICSQPDETGRLEPLCIEAGSRLIEEWETSDQQDDERRVAILKSLGKLAANTSLDKENQEVKDLREDALSVIFSGLREGINSAFDPLDRLRNCPDLTEEQREEINQRMGKAFGLQKTKP